MSNILVVKTIKTQVLSSHKGLYPVFYNEGIFCNTHILRN